MDIPKQAENAKASVFMIQKYLWKHKKYWLPFLIIFIFKLYFHGFALGEYPYYENDEATYIIRSLAFAEDGSLDLYTYWYDHAPFGWMIMSLWYTITGQAAIFGNLLNSGRLFIFLLSTASAFLVYLTTHRILKDRIYATLASLMFIISPLSIYFQRRVLLDNIMVFWLLLSVYFVISKPLKTRGVILSAITFSFAVLTKLNALFFAPAILYAVFIHTHKKIRVVGTMLWSSIAGVIMLMFPLYALLKSEFFSKNPDPSTGNFDNGISLIDSLTFQSSRGTENSAQFWESGSSFKGVFDNWLDKDPTFIYFSVLSLLFILLIVHKKWRTTYSQIVTINLIVLGMVLFMIRGGIVLEFYFIPILPFVTILMACLFYAPIHFHLFKSGVTRNLYVIVSVTAAIGLQLPYAFNAPAYRFDETNNMIQAIEWIENNIEHDSFIATDNYATVFLRYESDFTNVDYNYKYEYDPDIRKRIGDDWRNIDYIILTHEVIKKIGEGETPFLKEAFDHSELLVSFENGTTSFNDIDKYISTNGDWVRIYKVKSDSEIVTQQSWAGFLNDNFNSYGRIASTDNKSRTTSLYQSNSLIRALNEDERQWFDGIWAWTKDHIQSRSQDSLFSSEWVEAEPDDEDTQSRVTNPNTTSLADLEMAYALHRASVIWPGRDDYADRSREIVSDIWENEIVQTGDYYHMSAQQITPGVATDSYIVNPSYAALPYMYYFASLDSDPAADYPWAKLLDDSISMLEELQNDTTGLFPNWVTVNADGEYSSAEDFAGTTADQFGFEAFRIPVWLDQFSDLLQSNRVNTAQSSSQLNRVENMLKLYGNFVANEYTNNDSTINAIYTLDGQAINKFEDVLMYGISYLGLERSNPEIANDVFKKRIITNFSEDTGIWAQIGSDINNQFWLPIIINNSPGIISAAPIPTIEIE